MASYSVIDANGQAYGPVDESGLEQWVRQGRLTPSTAVRHEQTGTVQQAASLAFLAMAFATAQVPALPTQAYDSAHPRQYLPDQVVPYGSAAAGIHDLPQFSTVLAVILHFLTLGIFTSIWLNLMHGRMPKLRHDDPSAGKAIGFLFIPFFNLYWVFFTYYRLCSRIAEQRQMRGLVPNSYGTLSAVMCAFMIFPYIGVLSFFFIAPIFLGLVQSSVNELVEVSRQAA